MFSGVNLFAFYTGLGAVIGVWQVARRAPQQELARWIGAAWAVLLGCLLGSRAGFVFFHLTYYRNHAAEAFQLWRGGLDWPGALLGGLAAFAVVWRLWRAPPGRLADGLAPLVLPLAAGVWLGCWEAGCAYGGVQQGGLGLAVVDETGLVLRRFPLQALAVLALIVLAAWLDVRPFKSIPPGRYASRVMPGLGAVMLAAEFLRADPAPHWAGLRPGAWAALVLIAVPLAAIWKFRLYGGHLSGDEVTWR
ncbi:MAG: prolipoprotein diacylglyceryl transferase [Anaerolineaceae bacterium]|nr:prolipoprotein diacylglyceryl transferase [Anaerolineaceae bacterium]